MLPEIMRTSKSELQTQSLQVSLRLLGQPTSFTAVEKIGEKSSEYEPFNEPDGVLFGER